MEREIVIATFTGKRAVAAIAVLLLAWVGWTAVVHHIAAKHLDEAKGTLRIHLVAEGARAAMPADRPGWGEPVALEAVEPLARATDVELTRVEMRGSLYGRQEFHIEYTVAGAPAETYLGMRYSMLTGWRSDDLLYLAGHPVLFALAPWR